MSKLTVSIPDDLHQKIREELEKQGITTSQFIEQAVTNFFENPKGEINMATHTLAFQVSEELFQRVKAYLARYEEIYHRKLSQKEFVIGLIEAELDEADEEFAAAEAAAATENLEAEQAAEEPATDESAEEPVTAEDEDTPDEAERTENDSEQAEAYEEETPAYNEDAAQPEEAEDAEPDAEEAEESEDATNQQEVDTQQWIIENYDPKAYQIDSYIHEQSPDIAGAVEPELTEDEDDDTLGAGDQGVMVGYACDETPEYMPMAVVAAQRLAALLEVLRLTDAFPDIGPDGKVQVTMEYVGDIPARITKVVVSVQHSPETCLEDLRDMLQEKLFPLAFKGMPADNVELLLNPSDRFIQGGPDADTGLTGRKLMVDTYGPFVPHGGGAFSGKDPSKVDRSGAYIARFIAKNLVAARIAQRCQVTLAYAIGQAEPVMVSVDTFGTCKVCEDDCLAMAVRLSFDLTPAGIIKQLNLLNPIYARTATGGHFGREAFPWETIESMSEFTACIE